MSMPRLRTTVVFIALVCVVGSIAVAQETLAGHTAAYAGRAKGADIAVLGTHQTLSDTGPLPSSGGARESSAINERVPGLAVAKVLHASTVGAGDSARSEASLADLEVTAGGQSISANFAMARSSATCGDFGDYVQVDSVIAGLKVNGDRVTVSGTPNQGVSLGAAGRIVINEQRFSEDEAVVNALHIELASVDIVIASASSDITCFVLPPPEDDDDLPVPCPGVDFVTGGGWTKGTPSGAKANFGVAGGIDEDGELSGHLDFHEHGSNLKVKGTEVTRYVVVDETTRHIEGTAEIDGSSSFYFVDVTDNGEPGRSDKFSMRLSNGYSVSGYIGGGNIQLHLGCD